MVGVRSGQLQQCWGHATGLADAKGGSEAAPGFKTQLESSCGDPAARQELADEAGYPKPETFWCQAPQICLGVQLKHCEEVLIQSHQHQAPD